MGQKEEIEGEEPDEEPDAQNVDGVYVCTNRISSSSSSALSAVSHLLPTFFYRQTFRNEASPRLSSRSFREPADNQHKSRRAL